MAGQRCIHPDCAAQLARRVNYCPWCGKVQPGEAMPARAPAPAAAASPVVPHPAAPAPKVAPPAAAVAPRRERRTGIGFWIVALAVVFSFWVAFSGDKKPAPPGKLRHNAGQVQRK